MEIFREQPGEQGRSIIYEQIRRTRPVDGYGQSADEQAGLEVLNEDYVRTARSKGLREHTVILRHALRNALIPVVTMVGLQFGGLLGGAVITETVFAWPGAGSLAVYAVFDRDYPIVQGIVLIFSATFAIINLVVDIVYVFLDPRIRYR